jgi:SPP1 family predicted phage head-tail adaptor
MKCCDVTAGMLRHTVALERLTKTPDGAGGFVKAWNSLASVKAYMKVSSGSEQFSQDRLNAVQRVRAYIRYRSDLLPNDRLVFQGKNYQIRNINNLEFKNKYLELDLDSGVAT